MPPSMEVNGRTRPGGHKDINTIVDDIGHHRNRTSPADGSSLRACDTIMEGLKNRKNTQGLSSITIHTHIYVLLSVTRTSK